MEDNKAFIPLQPEGIKILKQSCSAFCRALNGKFGCAAQVHNVDDHTASSFSHRKATIVPEMKYHKRLSKNLKVSVWKDDLTTHKVDAVVNAANEYLSHGAGLALALCQAGGPQIQRYSDEIIKLKSKIPAGETVKTQAGNLPCKMIIHAVGPCVSPTATLTALTQASVILQKTIWSILQRADYENIQSVAIPAISSGLFNFPLFDCANIIVDTVKDFSQKRNPSARDLDVRLVNHDDRSIQEMQRACKEILRQPDPMPMQNQGNVPSQSLLLSLDLGNVTLHLKTGALENETTDVIVNTIGLDLNLSKGMVSAALLKKAGWNIQEEIKQHRNVSEGDVIPTAGYKLNCRAVYHTVCPQKSNTRVNKILSSVVKTCVMKSSSNGCSSISFPALGTGNLGLQKDEVAQIMTNAVVDFSKTHKGPKLEVFFVIFPNDTGTLQAFDKVMSSTNKRMQTAQIPSSTSGKSSGFNDSHGVGTTPCIELYAPSSEALQEAKRWSHDMLHFHSGLKIYNNHVVHLGQEDHERMMSLQVSFNVIITEFFREGKGGIIINGEPGEVSGAALEIEDMLCQAQEEFARSEEENMQDDLKHIYMAEDSEQQQIERTPISKYQKIQIDFSVNDKKLHERLSEFRKCGLQIVKMEVIQNHALKQLFELNKKRMQCPPRHLYQCVKAQFCDLICRVGFQRDYAPPKEQKYGAGIYFTSEVDKAKSLWTDSKEEYIYFIEAQVLTGKETLASPGIIVPPPIGNDPLVRYDSVTNDKGIHVIFNGQQAYPELLITCSNTNKPMQSPV